jgi:hypothetical protein
MYTRFYAATLINNPAREIMWYPLLDNGRG